MPVASQVLLVVNNLPAHAGDARDMGLIPGSGRSPGEGNGNLLQHSCRENPMDRGACQTTVYKVAKESDMTAHTHSQIVSYGHSLSSLRVAYWEDRDVLSCSVMSGSL